MLKPDRPSDRGWPEIDFSRLLVPEERRAAREFVLLSRAAISDRPIIGDICYAPHVREVRWGSELYVRHESLHGNETRITVYWSGATVFDSKLDLAGRFRNPEVFGKWEEALSSLRERWLLDALAFDGDFVEDR